MTSWACIRPAAGSRSSGMPVIWRSCMRWAIPMPTARTSAPPISGPPASRTHRNDRLAWPLLRCLLQWARTRAMRIRRKKPIRRPRSPGLEPPPALVGEKYIPLTFRSPAEAVGLRRRQGSERHSRPAQCRRTWSPSSMADIPGMDPPQSGAAKTEEFLSRSALNARVYAERIRTISSSIHNKATYPASRVGPRSEARRAAHRLGHADARLLREARRLRHPCRPAPAIPACWKN